jgi:hypothetical protein
LHPGLRAEWFKATVPKLDTENAQNTAKQADVLKAQEDAVEKAEALFLHVSQTYYENPPDSASAGLATAALASQHQPKSADWLESICDFEMALPPPAEHSEDLLKDEVRRYFRFEGGRCNLQDPLSWWKVCD